MPGEQLTRVQVLEMLSEQPQRIAELAKGVSPAQLQVPPEPGEWSVTEVLAHLRACADMWGGSIEQILADDHPTIRATNPRTWVRQTNYPELDFAKSFRAYLKQRKELVALLEALPPKDWARAATVTGAGRALERTVHFYAQWLVKHERPHIKQIAKTIEAVRGAKG